MKKLTKFLSIGLSSLLLFSFASCNQDNNSNKDNKGDEGNTQTVEERLELSEGWKVVDNYNIDKVVTNATFTVDKTVEEGYSVIPFEFFAEDMVMQRNSVNRVYGKTSSYSGKVAVEINDNMYYGTASNGSFDVYLPPMEQATNLTMTIYTERDKVVINKVSIGEVILFSGQSNMEWKMSYAFDGVAPYNAAKQFLTYHGDWTACSYVPTTNDPNYSQYVYNKDIATQYTKTAVSHSKADTNIHFMLLNNGYTPTQIGINKDTARKDYTLARKWQVAEDLDVIGKASMFAYYFCKVLRDLIDVPVGCIVASMGSTSTTCWISRDVLNADTKSVFPLVNENTSSELANCACYNTFIAPMLKYKVSSYVWYQGEGECATSAYLSAFPTLVNSYRTNMDNPNLKVLVVELPRFGCYSSKFPTGYTRTNYATADATLGMPDAVSTLGRVNQQLLPSLISNCALSVSVNSGDFDDIHVADKYDMSKNAVYRYLTSFYGFTDAKLMFPEVDEIVLNQDYFTIKFKNTGRGINVLNEGIGFEISENGNKWVQVKATRVDRYTISLEYAGTGINEPVYVRYGFLEFPLISRIDMSKYVSIYNEFGLPCDQFDIALDDYFVE